MMRWFSIHLVAEMRAGRIAGDIQRCRLLQNGTVQLRYSRAIVPEQSSAEHGKTLHSSTLQFLLRDITSGLLKLL